MQYTLKLTNITPFHIGTGETLERGFDYATYQGQTWILNRDAISEAWIDDEGRWADLIAGTPPAKLLKAQDFRPDNGLFYYVLKGVPQTGGQMTPVREQIKNTWGELYLPGSSVKGAMRSVLVRALFEQEHERPLDVSRLKRSKKWAGQRIEQTLLGSNPQRDLLKAWQVSDSAPLPLDSLALTMVRDVTPNGRLGAPIALECVRGDASFVSTWHISEGLLADRRFAKAGKWVAQLPIWANQQAKLLLMEQQKRFPKGSQAYALCQQLLNANLGDKQFLLQIGWGGGWYSKTLGTVLTQAEQKEVRYQYRLGEAGRPFPVAQRAIGHNAPLTPLGWFLITMKEGKHE